MLKMFYPILALTTSFVISISSHAEQAAMFSINSSSFVDRQTIPALYTCDGNDISPQLRWSGTPAKTQSLALICEDPDAPAGTWYHWVVYNIPNSVTELAQNASLPAEAKLGKNSWGRVQYNGPCPPASSIHRYNFTLYALDIALPLSSGESAEAVLSAMQGHVLGKAIIMGVFGH